MPDETKSKDYDWTRFDVCFYYDVPRETVFRAWVTSRGLESFFLETAEHRAGDGAARGPDEAARAGDTYRWMWRHGHGIEGRFLEVESPTRISFTFGGMRVDIRLVEVAGGCRLDLEQTEIPDTDDGRVRGHLNCRSCWIFFLTNLKSRLAGGTDLRDELPERASSMEVGFVRPVGDAVTG